MKKGLIVGVVSVVILLGIGAVSIGNIKNIIEWDNDHYYVKVSEKGSGIEKGYMDDIQYKVTGYGEDGKGKKLEFGAPKQLRIGAYLQIGVDDNEVETYKEVKENEVPKKAFDKLK